jgi:hypothetical protein
MAQLTRKNPWKDELWNVSLLPTVKATPCAEPPPGPGPAGGRALQTPALLSLQELTTLTLPQAA